MNKIYKVVWSKAKHTYVVASEIAKGHTKGETTGKGLKKLAAAMLVAAALLSPSFAWAADTVTVEPATIGSTTAVEVYTKKGTDDQVSAARTYTYRKVAAEEQAREAADTEIKQAMTDQKTSTALHVSSSGDLIVGTNEKQRVKDMEIRGQLTSGSISTGNIASSGDVTVKGKMAADGVTDDTTKDGTYIKQNNTVGNNLGSLDTQVKANADAIAKKADQAALDETNAEVAKKADASNVYTKAETDSALSAKANAADVYTKTDVDNKLATDKTSTALHVSKDGNLIVGTKENQIVNDMKINKQLTSGSISTGDITSSGDVTVTGKMAADGVTDETTKDGTYIKQNNTVGNNLGSLDTQVKANADAINEEATAREKEDARLNSEIVNTNKSLNEAATNLSKLNTAVVEGFKELNQADANEAKDRDAADKTLQSNINKETADRKAADEALDSRAKALEDKTEAITYDKDSKTVMVEGKLTATEGITDGTTQNGNYVKADNHVGQNLNALDQGLQDESVARQKADAAEKEARITGDTGSLKLDSDNQLVKQTYDETNGYGSEAITELVVNKNADNQVKINSEGVTVGLNSTQMDAEGFTAGGHDYDAAGAALMSDGRIKGANGAFTVDAAGNVASGNVTSTGTVKGATLTDGTATISNGNIKTNGGYIQTGGGNVNTQGGEVRTNGGKVATSGGEINTGSGDIKTVGGNILTAGGKLNTSGGDIVAGTGNISGQNITASGAIQGKSISDGTATMQNGNITGVKNLSAETITTSGNADIGGDLTVKGKLNVDEIDLTKSGIVGDNQVTASTKVAAGEITSYKEAKNTKDGSKKESAFDYDENGTSTWVQSTDADNNWNKSTLTVKGNDVTSIVVDSNKNKNVSTQTASESGSTISSLADEKQKSYITQNLKKILQGIQNGDNATTVDQTETGIKSTATDGKNTASTNLSNKGFNTYATDGTNKTYTLQTAESLTSQIGDDGKVKSVMNADGITNNADGGTITNSAKDLVNTASENMTNTVGKDLTTTVGGEMKTTVTGKVTEDFKSDRDTTIGGNKSETVTGTSTETVTGKKTENYNGGLETTVTGEEKHTVNGNQTNIITRTQTTTVTGDVTEDYKANLSTTVGGNQTTTVTGNSSLTAENIKNEAKNKITNTALDVETDASSSIVNKVSNEYGSNTSTQLSYETKEEMSQADGKTASYLRGAAEEKSQLTDGDKKTTIDTIAGQTNTNITDGTNTSNSLQKADQVASSVTDGTYTTVVDQKAGRLASSITDGKKANNTNNTVDKSEQLIKADDTHSYAETKTAGSAVEALKSDGNTIIIAKDAATGTVSSAVTDGATITGISQNAKDINLSAAGGTIANSAADIENTASNSIISQIGDGTAVKSEMTAGGIANKATGKSITNDAATITNTGTTSVTNQVGSNKVLVDTTQVKSAFGDTIYTTWAESGITNNATDKTVATNAKDILNTASDSITDKVGENVERTMGTKKITESVKDGDKSNTFTKTADKDINTVTDGTNTSTESQLAGSVNTSLKEVDAEGKTTKSLNNVKTVSEDTTKITDTTSGAFSKRSQTASQVQDRVGKTTITTTDGLTKLTNEDGTHSTQMDFAEVLKDLGVRGNAVVDGTSTLKGDVTMESNATIKGDTTMEGNASVGKNLTVAGKSTLTDDVTMKSNATVEKDLTVNGKSTLTDDVTMESNATVKKNLTVDGETSLKNTKVDGTLNVTGESTFDGMATFKDAVSIAKDLNVGGNATVAGDVTANSYKVGDKTYIDENGINANGKVIQNVGKGDISSADSTDAVSGGQLYETNTRVTGLETRMGTVETKVDKLDNKIDKVGANAAAMANLHPLEFDEDSKWNIAAAVGSSGSETASAVGVFYRPNENVMVNASAAMGTGENMFGGGVSLRLGQGGNKTKAAQMKAAAKENRELRAKVDDLTARMDALLSVLNPNMSKDFPDVPENHWAYEAVSRLAGNGIVEGYEDGKYHGERQMTRYEMAEIIYNALSKGAKAEKKLVEEFRPELQAMAAQKRA